MKNTLLIAILVLTLSACEWGKPPKADVHPVVTDTLVYSYKTIHQRASDCGNKPDSGCTVVKVRYPEFKGQGVLNDTLQKRLLNVFMLSEKPDTSLSAMTTHFLKSYADFKATENRSGIFYELDTYAKVIQQDSSLISIEYGGYNYMGGAHGGSFTGFLNWDTKAGRQVKLKDILVENYHDKLTAIAEEIFRKDEKLGPNDSLEPNYFFKNAKFSLNENYAITPLGLRFMYNQYEIKPYAAGTTELFIPYNSIKPLIKPGAVITQFTRKNAGI